MVKGLAARVIVKHSARESLSSFDGPDKAEGGLGICRSGRNEEKGKADEDTSGRDVENRWHHAENYTPGRR
jgi:hypothetical protein